ncbi:MAG: hypothetical protein M3H12_10485 [Chromatiales bacterium]|nr:hypothetical protein [Gammaproteobacteria bacterium]
MKSRLLQIMATAGLMLPLAVIADGNTAIVEQDGIDNVATIIQQDATTSYAGIYQTGDMNLATIDQTGMTDAYEEIHQTGPGNELIIEMVTQDLFAEQIGEGNFGHLVGDVTHVFFRQNGENNSAYFGMQYGHILVSKQEGNDNQIYLGWPSNGTGIAYDITYIQNGEGNEILAYLDGAEYQDIVQAGDRNYIKTQVTDGYTNELVVSQFGDDNWVDSSIGWGADQHLLLSQKGMFNRVTTSQHRGRNELSLLQIGDDNLINVYQNSDNTGFVEQTGNNNQVDLHQWTHSSATVMQSGNFNVVNLTQEGDGNTAEVTQR